MSTDTFHPFPRLPWDIRRIIWEMTVEPRTVAIRLGYGPPLNPNSKNYTRVVSPTPVPATLHTCQEARDLGLYQRVSTDSFGCSDPEPYKYFWLNWDTDLIDIHDCPFAAFDRIAPLIKRLKFESDFYHFATGRDEDYWGEFKFKEFSHIFPNAEEIHVVCAAASGLNQWSFAWYRFLYFIGKEDFFIIDAMDPSRIMNILELE